MHEATNPAAAAPAEATAWPVAARLDRWIMLGIFAAAVAYLVGLPRGLGFGDESTVLYEAKRIRDGEVMYRDFFQFVAPLPPIAATYWLFGTSMATARAAMAVIHSLTATLLYASARRLGVRRGFAGAVPLAYLGVMQPVWPVVSYHWFATCFTMLLLWTLLADPAERARRWSLREGVWAGLLIVTQQHKGLVVAAGISLLFLVHALIQQHYGVPAAWRRAVARTVWFATGTAIVSLPVLGVFFAVAGGDALYDALIRFPLESYREALHARWGYIGLSAPRQAALSYPVLLHYAPWAALPALLYAMVVGIRRRERQTVQQLASLLIVSGASTLSPVPAHRRPQSHPLSIPGRQALTAKAGAGRARGACPRGCSVRRPQDPRSRQRPDHRVRGTTLSAVGAAAAGTPARGAALLPLRARGRAVRRRAALVFRVGSSSPISASNRRLWQGAPTQEYRECFEEAQRRQRRRGAGEIGGELTDSGH